MPIIKLVFALCSGGWALTFFSLDVGIWACFLSLSIPDALGQVCIMKVISFNLYLGMKYYTVTNYACPRVVGGALTPL